MDFRQATLRDLERIRSVFERIIQHMNEQQIEIWDDVYPCEYFEEDIREGRLYGLFDGEVPVAAFALCDSNSGERAVQWRCVQGKALYLDRFGVNVDYARRGIGSRMLDRARETARALGAKNLRLFVVDVNRPAIRLYEKCGFERAAGVYDEVIDDDFVLREYGYEAVLE